MLEANLEGLKKGFPAISKSIGQYLAEGGAYCLEMNGHASGVVLLVEGDFSEQIKLLWKDKVNDQVKRAWNETQEATEYGATAIALVILQELTDYTVIERSFTGTGFDYWLGTGEYDENLLPFEQRKARLEISGIWRASESNTIDARVQIKRKQLEQSDSTQLPGLIIVVEFGTPTAKFVIK